ncbi:ABC transporter permease [Chryseolinea sp. T2]|uniref:ABC transporter permease n=1 Tax=Chryseolinea sp. T2 TaxID=3129255 RepID=UPI0030788203
MFTNYLKVAFRNIFRTKVYTAINVFGLSLGVTSCLLLALYIQDELSYDRHQERLDDLYILTTHFTSGRGLDAFAAVSPPVTMTIREEVPEVENAARILAIPGVTQSLIKYEDKVFYETDGLIADSTIFDVLTYEFIEGTPHKALTDPNTVVITDKLAGKLFGSGSALDKMININQGGTGVNYKITGVIKDNLKTHLHVNFLTSMMSEGMGAYLRSPEANQQWAGNNFIPGYLKLVPGADRAAVKRKINEVLQRHGAKSMEALGMKKTLDIYPVKDMHLRTFNSPNPRITYLYVISSIAVFVLVIACINFMNLSTARATKRASEIGVRKVMGAFRSALVSQIMGEALLIVTVSMLISVILVQVALPMFNELTMKEITFGTDNILYFAGALVLFTIVTGLLAGSYPAFYLSSFNPAEVLKGKFSMSNASGLLRKSLVVVQFMIAITLICGMIVISQQLTFMRNKNLGFDPSAKVYLPLRSDAAKQQYASLQTELEKEGILKNVSATDYLPGSRIFHDMSFYTDGKDMNSALNMKRNSVDHNYMDLMGVKLIAGRGFTDNYKMESNKLILNQKAVKSFGETPESMIGKRLHFDWQDTTYHFEVIGVMEDYHQRSLKEEIDAMSFEMNSDNKHFEFLIGSIDTQHMPEKVAKMESVWNRIVPDSPFDYSLLDDTLQKQYDEDRRISRIITYFTVLAMLISCLGLYGLSTYMAERRFKEIGVRKVLGANVNSIVALMSKEFIKLVIIAFAISVPLAWYAMNRWLEGFAYAVGINFMIFVYAGLGALAVALLTVSFESVKAASQNPVNSLRSE